ncbi:hypothetical protein [Pseudomonas jinjuensis]|uniref:TniQ protein n=1 Tax=Pseudomonas jinjuensis TaxID=198616 RepID=A0A1H0EFK3_9PSED|nr:hypothetical protein [Pseudomonas jinjuensis]SDN81100.1 hypothetical protein SAMN05216193_105153 [Pseudomonas jinjuensis]
MHYKNGLFFPDNFPWPFDHAVAILHKAAVVNGVSGRVVLRMSQLMKSRRGSKKGRETQIEEALGEICSCSRCPSSYSNLIKGIGDFFPKNAFGPIKYCAECLAETGFVPTVFSLRFVASCPWHHHPLKPLCERCHDVRKFKPTPFGNPVGYRCKECGYWVPSRAAIFAACRSHTIVRHGLTCFAFYFNTERLHRLAVMDVIHFNETADDGRQALIDGCAIQEFLRDETTTVWRKKLDLNGPCAELSLPDEYYRDFVRFHQERLLKAHRDCTCCAVLSRPDFGDTPRSVCVYNAALSIFRQKFEYLSSGNVEPRLSEQAVQQLVKLQLQPWEARRFFQCVFYQLLARLRFWSCAASRFFVHIDPRHFFAVLNTDYTPVLLSRFLGKYLRTDYLCKFDLPTNRAALRQLLGPAQAGQALVIRNFGTRAELSTSATSRLFYGSLRATAMFYF